MQEKWWTVQGYMVVEEMKTEKIPQMFSLGWEATGSWKLNKTKQ